MLLYILSDEVELELAGLDLFVFIIFISDYPNEPFDVVSNIKFSPLGRALSD